MDGETLRFRRAVIDDIPAIQRVGKVAWTQIYAPLIPGGYIEDGLANYWSTEAFTHSIEDPQAIIQVALSEDQIVGIAQMSIVNLQRAYLWKLYLLPDMQKRGIGGQLLNTGLGLLPEGVLSVGTSIITGNQRAQRFYEKHGFILSHTKEVEAMGYRISLTRFDKQL